ncbi:MAG: nucleotidyltransferase domain-containing protein [bacterium]|nr:nucleotidyltransferase domain-containing protein [bacterium]
MKTDNQKLNKEAPKKGIKLVVLFGSQVEKKARSDSDYDIAVLTTREKSIRELDNYSNVLHLLCEALDIPDYKIDLTNLNDASSFLRNEIAIASQLIYGNEDDFAAFKANAMRQYIATRDLRELEEKLINKRQRILAEKIYV